MNCHGKCQGSAVVYEDDGADEPVVVCHCRQCRTWSGHRWASSAAPAARFRLAEERGLCRFQSSGGERRGFCGTCGTSLFWQKASDRICFSARSLDGPTGLEVARRMCVAEATAGPTADLLEAGCMCGAVRFALPGPAGEVEACHCNQCRKMSGHFAASFDVEKGLVRYEARDGLAEFRSANGGTRGFCSKCGSSLWFRTADGEFSVKVGAVKGDAVGPVTCHIFVAEKGGYFRIGDDAPQFAGNGEAEGL